MPPNAQGELQGILTGLMSLTSIVGPLLMTHLFYYFTKKSAPVHFPGAPFVSGRFVDVGKRRICLSQFIQRKTYNAGIVMNLLGNIIWLVFGGFVAAIGYIVRRFRPMLNSSWHSWGLQCFKLAAVVLWPFGKSIVPKRAAKDACQFLCNIIWLICGGFYTAFIHLLFAAFLYHYHWGPVWAPAFETNGTFPVTL